VGRWARCAVRIDSGELDHRIRASGGHDEVRVLADAFDHMLDRLQDAFDRQREFVADASHELRTPLTVIAGQLEVLALQESIPREEIVRVQQLVRTEVKRMERLIDELLLLARADRHDLLRLEPIELRPFLNELFTAITVTADRKFVIGPVPEGVLQADGDRLAQVIRNLIANAIEHTGQGGLVQLSTTAKHGSIEIAIDDDGVGIPPAQRDRIFDRFHRTDHSRARASGGTGLGLAIARAIVTAHGGRIWAAESPSGGARIAFELPDFTASRGHAEQHATGDLGRTGEKQAVSPSGGR